MLQIDNLPKNMHPISQILFLQSTNQIKHQNAPFYYWEISKNEFFHNPFSPPNSRPFNQLKNANQISLRMYSKSFLQPSQAKPETVPQHIKTKQDL